MDEEPAFPCVLTVGAAGKAGPIHHQYPGMTLRDYFAAAALEAFTPWDWTAKMDGFEQHAENLARTAYGVADAMLKERGK